MNGEAVAFRSAYRARAICAENSSTRLGRRTLTGRTTGVTHSNQDKPGEAIDSSPLLYICIQHTYKLEGDVDRLANLLNATATAIADAQAKSIALYADLNPSTAAAILTLGQHPALSVSELAGILGLSHSATVRLVGGLAVKSLARRSDRQDRREVAVSLTDEGLALYRRLRKAQSQTLMPLIQIIEPAERAMLETTLSRILAAMTLGRESADRLCRFCDETVCQQEDCPVGLRAIALEQA